jgi:hypothetical protein
MKLRLFFIAVILPLTGCDSATESGGAAPQSSSEVGDALDKLAIEKGILPDINNLVFAGRFETRSELGTDKFCAVKSGDKSYNIGVLAVFGPESKCEGQGTASVDGEKVRITLQGKETCRFDAEYDGIELRFPGGLEQGCESYCSARASLSGTSYFIVEQGDENARRTLGRDIELLCG